MSKAEPERRPLAEVDPVLAEYASALLEVETPPVDRIEATWAAVEAQTRRPFRLWLPALILAAAAILGFVLVGPSSVLEREETSRPKQTPYGSDTPGVDGRAKAKPQPSPPKPEHLRVLEAAPVPEAVPEVPLEPDAVAPAPREPKRPQPASSGPSSLAQETSLLREIQKAQAEGEHARVLTLTREHARRFPKGTFAAERTLARVRALCSLGRTQDARSARDGFIRKHPQSHLRNQFESSCAP